MPELRKDPVVGRWVIMATERGKRPSDFKPVRDQRKGPPCAFCAGMEQMTPPEVLSYRENGSQPNGPGWQVRAVSNKFPENAAEALREALALSDSRPVPRIAQAR